MRVAPFNAVVYFIRAVQPISLMILADGKTYNIVKRRVSDEARREVGGDSRETKRKRSDTPVPSGRQLE